MGDVTKGQPEQPDEQESPAESRRDERVSLHPLDPEDALRALLSTPPHKDDADADES